MLPKRSSLAWGGVSLLPASIVSESSEELRRGIVNQRSLLRLRFGLL